MDSGWPVAAFMIPCKQRRVSKSNLRLFINLSGIFLWGWAPEIVELLRILEGCVGLRGKFCAVPDIAHAYPLPFLLRESNLEYKIPHIRKKLVIKRLNFG
jgi:hypothetical protein